MKNRLITWQALLASSLLLLFGSFTTHKQAGVAGDGKQYNAYAVVFYNLENLFDYEDDPDNTGDDDFLPTGPYRWTRTQYERKLDNLARVLSQLGKEVTPYGAAFFGVSEVENRRVLEDLVLRDELKGMGLKVIHEDSPDRRGIDVAALYNPNIFTLEGYQYHRLNWDERPDFLTRDQLHVYGHIAGERVHFIVVHWPSRYGGGTSEHLRLATARLSKEIIDGIHAEEPDAKIILMGDFNDDPTNNSVTEVLNAKSIRSEVGAQGLYSPAASLLAKGIGTLVYNNSWNFFDQMIISKGLLKEDSKLRLWKMEVFNRDFLVTQEGKRKGYPHRTFENNSFIDGYSDHFPVIVYLVQERQLVN